MDGGCTRMARLCFGAGTHSELSVDGFAKSASLAPRFVKPWE